MKVILKKQKKQPQNSCASLGFQRQTLRQKFKFKSSRSVVGGVLGNTIRERVGERGKGGKGYEQVYYQASEHCGQL